MPTLGGVVVHFVVWPWRRGAPGVPVFAEADGLDDSKLPAYNALLYRWGAASALSTALEVPPYDRRWALLGFAVSPLLYLPPGTTSPGSPTRLRRARPGGTGASGTSADPICGAQTDDWVIGCDSDGSVRLASAELVESGLRMPGDLVFRSQSLETRRRGVLEVDLGFGGSAGVGQGDRVTDFDLQCFRIAFALKLPE